MPVSYVKSFHQASATDPFMTGSLRTHIRTDIRGALGQSLLRRNAFIEGSPNNAGSLQAAGPPCETPSAAKALDEQGPSRSACG